MLAEPEVRREFEKSPEWQQFEEDLLAVAEEQIQKVQGNVPAKSQLHAEAARKPGPERKLQKNAPSRSPLLSKYRSELKRGILIQLTQNPGASDLEICRGLDADGSAELPAKWKPIHTDRSFAQAYRDSKIRHKIEIAISKIRADLRRQG